MLLLSVAIPPAAAAPVAHDRDTKPELPPPSAASPDESSDEDEPTGARWTVIGGFEHFSEIIAGEAWLDETRNQIRFELEGTTTRLKCIGPGEIESSIVKPDQCREIEGGFNLLCGVNRELFGSFEYNSCGYGFAAGIDSFTGSTVALHFALPPENFDVRMKYLETYAATQPALIDPFETPETSDIDPEVYGFGTGFAITEDGIILTAAHVVDDEYGIKVRSGDRVAEAEIIAVDRRNDLALLKADMSFDPLVLMDLAPDSMKEFGAEAIGYRFAFDGTRTQRAEPTIVPSGKRPGYYFFEADIIPGYSGGPLLTVPEYKVAGVLNAISVRYALTGWNDYRITKMTYATDYDSMMTFLEKSLDDETMASIVARSKAAPQQAPIDDSEAIVLVLVY